MSSNSNFQYPTRLHQASSSYLYKCIFFSVISKAVHVFYQEPCEFRHFDRYRPDRKAHVATKNMGHIPGIACLECPEGEALAEYK